MRAATEALEAWAGVSVASTVRVSLTICSAMLFSPCLVKVAVLYAPVNDGDVRNVTSL